jgi:hypothetical protein
MITLGCTVLVTERSAEPVGCALAALTKTSSTVATHAPPATPPPTTVLLATSVTAMLFLSVGESGDNNCPSPFPRSRSNLLPPQARAHPLKKKVAALGEDRASCKASCVLGSRLSTHVGCSVEKAQPRRGEHVQRL